MDSQLTPQEERNVRRAENSINAFIEGRAREVKAARAAEALWVQSVRRYHEKRNLNFTKGWLDFYQRLARSHESLASEYRAKAECLTEVLKEKSNGSV